MSRCAQYRGLVSALFKRGPACVNLTCSPRVRVFIARRIAREEATRIKEGVATAKVVLGGMLCHQCSCTCRVIEKTGKTKLANVPFCRRFLRNPSTQSIEFCREQVRCLCPRAQRSCIDARFKSDKVSWSTWWVRRHICGRTGLAIPATKGPGDRCHLKEYRYAHHRRIKQCMIP